MNELELEELNSAIARYLPDRQLITFSAGMQIVPKEENGESAFANPKNISYLIHEWMHYLHNISTLHGISAFVSLVELWSAFRYTTNSLGISSGKINHPSPELFKVKALIEIFTAARKSMAKKLPSGILLENVKVTSFVEQGAMKNGYVTYLDISVLLANNENDQTSATIVLGPGEILESVAFLLEKRFFERITQKQVEQPSIVPYHVLTIFAQFVGPSLTEDDVLFCGLASLQSTSPASDLVRILKACDSIDQRDGERREYLTRQVVDRMKSHESTYLSWLKRLDEMFSVSNSMGLAVKETLAYMRNNLKIRTHSPFFEVDFIEKLHSAGSDGFQSLMDKLMVTHGMCAGLQEYDGLDDDVGRDILFDFAVVGQDSELNESRRVMQASFHFLSRHITADGNFLATADARKGACPFYTSCTVSVRKESPVDCKNEPWYSSRSISDNPCWYGQGVLNLRPGTSLA